MLEERHGVSTAKALLSKSRPSSGVEKIIVDFKRPDLTMEFHVLKPKYRQLFSDSEIRKAKSWLGQK
jgi:hypothetical protein